MNAVVTHTASHYTSISLLYPDKYGYVRYSLLHTDNSHVVVHMV